MYEYAVVEYLQQYREHSTAQSPLHKAANQVRANQSTHQNKCVRTFMRRQGCFPGAWSSWHLQVACKSPVAPKMLDHLLYLVIQKHLPKVEPRTYG